MGGRRRRGRTGNRGRVDGNASPVDGFAYGETKTIRGRRIAGYTPMLNTTSPSLLNTRCAYRRLKQTRLRCVPGGEKIRSKERESRTDERTQIERLKLDVIVRT